MKALKMKSLANQTRNYFFVKQIFSFREKDKSPEPA